MRIHRRRAGSILGLMKESARTGPDLSRLGQVIESWPPSVDVVGGGVGPGVPRAQQHRRWFPGTGLAVVDERPQRVEAKPLLECRPGLFLLRMGRDQGRVQVHDQRVLHRHRMIGRVPTRERPRPTTREGPGPVDRREHPVGVVGEPVDGP
jgi:hypothetical protein